MRRDLWRGRRFPLFLIAVALAAAGIFVSILVFKPLIQPWLKTLTAESKRVLGLERKEVFPEEKRIREEVILKKMEEASLQFDWRAIAPEYPKPRNLKGVPEKEKMKILKETPEFKEMDREVKDYARKKEDLFKTDPPLPSAREGADFTQLRDKGTEKVIQKLLSSKEKISPERAVEENLRLGIKGPVASRRILERPSVPPLKVRVETEIELTFWVLPDGMVDRAIPSVKGDAELERMAIQYLKQWRFAPLSRDQPQVEQWGTLPIKFKIQ
jgi:TonB family protein